VLKTGVIVEQGHPSQQATDECALESPICLRREVRFDDSLTYRILNGLNENFASLDFLGEELL
jgi:hypothetical protein